MYGMLRRKKSRRHPCVRAPSRLVERPIFLPRQGGYSVRFQGVAAEAQFLTCINPIQYGPRDFGGGYCRDLAKTDAGVESMADDAREKGDREQPQDNEAALSARFKRLGEQLGHVHPDRHSEDGTSERRAADPSAIARGFRLSTELVAAVVVGAALGWLVDRWLGISPWGMIVFLLLGFAAGVLNVMRAAGVAVSGPLDPKQ